MVLLKGIETVPVDYRAFKCSRLVKDLRSSSILIAYTIDYLSKNIFSRG